MFTNHIDKKKKIGLTILNNPNEILKYLQLGTNIPIWPEFHQYIINDLNFFKAESILISDNGNPIGNVLTFSDSKEILNFGYFGVISNNKNDINLLLESLMNYAIKKNFKIIRGPINIPTIIFGWGFLQEGSFENLFIGKPVNPPIYQEIFLSKGFSIKVNEKSWEGQIPKIDLEIIKNLDMNDYELFNPKDWNELMDLKPVFQKINYKNMPPGTVITPSIEKLFNNYAEFVCKYGDTKMFYFLRYKPTGELIACMSNIPNVFRKDDQGNYDSLIPLTLVIDSKFRQKGLAIFMTGKVFNDMYRNNIRYISGPAGSENEASNHIAKKLGLKNRRTHLILELKL